MRDESETRMLDNLEASCGAHFWWEFPSCLATAGRLGSAEETKSGAFGLFNPVPSDVLCTGKEGWTAAQLHDTDILGLGVRNSGTVLRPKVSMGR